MKKNFWTTAIVATAGLVLLLTPAISEAQRRGGGSGARGRVGGAYYSGRGFYRDSGRGYYPGYYGLGLGWGWGYPYYYPPYYYGGYYPTDYGTVYSNAPQYTYYPGGTTQSYYPATMPTELTNPNDAGFIVRVPDPNAEVWFQDYQTKQRGLVRQYESDQLTPNATYSFTVRARWNQDGQTMDQTRQVNARAGQKLTIDFTNPVREQVPTAPRRKQPHPPSQ